MKQIKLDGNLILNEAKQIKISLDNNQNHTIESKNIKNQELDEKSLWLIANEYDNLLEWKRLAARLGLTRQDIQIIESKYLHKDGIVECLYQVLLKWRVREPENSSFAYFKNVLMQSRKLLKNKKEKFFLKIDKIQENNSINNEKNINKLRFYIKLLNLESRIGDLANIKLSQKDLWFISGLVCGEWRSISRVLELNENQISQIEAKYLSTDGLRECCYQSLLTWSEIFNEKTNLEEICLTLLSQNLNLYLKKLLENYFLNEN